jgi:hypothetical protein
MHPQPNPSFKPQLHLARGASVGPEPRPTDGATAFSIRSISKGMIAKRLSLALGAMLCLVVASGFSLAATASAAYPWSTSLQTGAEISAVRVSCSSSTFCLAIGHDQGDGKEHAWTYNGSGWAPGPSFTPKEGPPWDISCASSSFCVATGDHGWAWTYNGATWEVSSSQLNSGAFVEIPNVSCASETLCVAGGGALGTGAIWNFDGHTWTISFPGHGEVGAVSCAAPSLCVAGDDDAYLYVFDGHQWGPATNPGFTRSISGVSCASTDFCMAVDGGGYEASVYDGSSWKSPMHIESEGALNRVSCASPTFCVVSDEGGYAMRFDGHSWSVPVQVSAASDEASSVSCPSEIFCMAVEGSYVFAYSGGAWPGAETPKPGGQMPQPRAGAPKVKIAKHPPKETPEQTASFEFTGVAGGSYECSVDAGAWGPCRSGDSFGPLQPGDHRFEVREVLKGLTGPPASYAWTVDLPRACVLKWARARVSAFTRKSKARLIIHYKAYKPAQVTVSYALTGTRGNLRLGTASEHFKTAGLFKQREKLGKGAMAKLRATRSMTVRFSIPEAPSSCTRYYTKRLTIPHHSSSGLTTWFQSDSIFGPEAK